MSCADEFDAIIAGASIAGSAAAALLAKQGRKVLLLEKERFPRDKVCGEGLMPPGVRILEEMGVLQRLPLQGARSFRGVRFRIADGSTLDLDFSALSPEVRGWAFPRLCLDGSLAEFAQEHSGVTFLQGFRVRALSIGAGGAIVEGEQGGEVRRLRGRVLLGANGIRSRIPRRFSLQRIPSRFRRFALRARLSEYLGDESLVTVHCSSAGEAYVAPQPDGGALATLLLTAPVQGLGGRSSEAFLSLLRRFPGLRADIPIHCRPLRVQSAAPLGMRLTQSHSRRLLLIGDAGGAVDPVTGQGMTLALRDACLAAEVLSDRLTQDRLEESDLAAYSSRRNEYFLPSFRFAEGLLSAMRSPFVARRTIRSLNRSPVLRRKILSLAAGFGPQAPMTWLDKLRLLAGV